jgi:nucleotide-binding universal stress UspA family protein
MARNNAEENGEIRRILIAFDATRESLQALEEAASLAARLEAELAGVFIEDEDVVHLAGLPFAREVGFGAHAHRPLDLATVEREFRAVAREARRALERAATPRHVRWTFRVVRGRLEQELLNAAGDSDMVAVGKTARPPALGRRLGAAARTLAAAGSGAVLLAEPGRAVPEQRIAVSYDASACAQRALTVAARLAHGGDSTLDVLVLAPDDETARKLETEAADRLRGWGVTARFRTLPPGDTEALKHAVGLGARALLVLGAECYPLPQEELERLIGETGCPVLLIRAR